MKNGKVVDSMVGVLGVIAFVVVSFCVVDMVAVVVVSCCVVDMVAVVVVCVICVGKGPVKKICWRTEGGLKNMLWHPRRPVADENIWWNYCNEVHNNSKIK